VIPLLMATADIGEVLGSGFQLWKRNLILCVPFILGALISTVVAIVIFFPTIMAIFLPYIQQAMTNPTAAQSPEFAQQILTTFVQNLWPFIGVIIIIAILDGFIMSFFYSGAIGMAKEAILTGHTNLQHMMSYGKKKFISYFGASVLTGLVLLVGILFLIPGLMSVVANADLISSGKATSTQILEVMIPLIYGSVFLVLYILPLSIILPLVNYAVVLDDLGSIQGFRKGIHVFWKNKINTFLLWLLLIVGAIVIWIFGLIPYIGWILTFLLMYLIYLPMITLWFSKLYLTATKT
jgi:hypothetical protein